MRHLGDGRYALDEGSTVEPLGGLRSVFASAAREGVAPGQVRDVLRQRQALEQMSHGELEEAAAMRDVSAARHEQAWAPTEADRRAAADRVIDAELRLRALLDH